MQASFSGNIVHSRSMPSIASTSAGFRHPEWELSSNSHENSSSSINSSWDNHGGELQERIERLLSHWEDTTSEVIMKWGSIGVKSSEYTKILHRNIIEKKQREEEERELQKIRAERKTEQKRRERQTRMASNFWARRHEKCKKSGSHEFVNRNRTPPKEEPHPSKTQRDIETRSCSVPIRQTHIATVQKLRKRLVTTPITHTALERHETKADSEYISKVFPIEVDQLSWTSSGKNQDNFSEKRNHSDQPILSAMLISYEEQQQSEKKESLVVEEYIPYLTASEFEEATVKNESSSLLIMPVAVQTETKLLASAVEGKEEVIDEFEDDSFKFLGAVVKDMVPPKKVPHGDATNELVMTHSNSSSINSSKNKSKRINKKGTIETIITAKNKNDEVIEHKMEVTEFKKDFPDGKVEANDVSLFDSTEATGPSEEEQEKSKESVSYTSIHSASSQDETKQPHSETLRLEKSLDESGNLTSANIEHSVSTVKEESGTDSIYSDDFEVSSISENDAL
ncbi:uncharacterized protein TM35_000341660 [Trypanosoma theileri]|uniref:Uncharacterized protein n=1 Tax=Trypanosoma theileri TaxID=67003 RepID=A0A1X0NLB9_9TRYP|nr:uncharacterized protein TM35_000341660 [Trypanosoma theileri]ORC85554.1 hypothetical protein TM35_000341660 [Trypanosoma theileri]